MNNLYDKCSFVEDMIQFHPYHRQSSSHLSHSSKFLQRTICFVLIELTAAKKVPILSCLHVYREAATRLGVRSFPKFLLKLKLGEFLLRKFFSVKIFVHFHPNYGFVHSIRYFLALIVKNKSLYSRFKIIENDSRHTITRS